MTTKTATMTETGGRIRDDKSVRWEFASFSAMVDAAETAARVSTMPVEQRSSHRAEIREGRGGWYRSASFADALRLAREGWSEGREQASRFTASITDQVRGRMKVTEYEPVTVGPIFDLGAYMQDEPQFMLMTTESERDMSNGGIVRIVIDVGVSAAVDADTLIRRGAAVIALVDALESQGRRCEVTATYCAGRGTYDSRANGSMGLSIATVIKRAGDYVNMDVLAFAVAHPSSFRRLAFALYESVNADLRAHHGLNGGYGQAQTLGDIPHDVRIKAADLYGDAVWATEASATKEVLRLLREQGIEVTM
jgi:hypothetical protein